MVVDVHVAIAATLFCTRNLLLWISYWHRSEIRDKWPYIVTSNYYIFNICDYLDICMIQGSPEYGIWETWNFILKNLSRDQSVGYYALLYFYGIKYFRNDKFAKCYYSIQNK